MSTLLGKNQLDSMTSLLQKAGKLALSGVDCGTGTCDNVTGINLNAHVIMNQIGNQGIGNELDLGYLV
jgi:hypothetical protein